MHLTQVNHAVIHKSGIFVVISEPLKTSLRNGINNHKNHLAKLIDKQIQAEL